MSDCVSVGSQEGHPQEHWSHRGNTSLCEGGTVPAIKVSGAGSMTARVAAGWSNSKVS